MTFMRVLIGIVTTDYNIVLLIVLFQLFVLGIMGWWVFVVMTFNGSPA